jgi:guanylate kinase
MSSNTSSPTGVVVLSGPSGSGKSTVVGMLLEQSSVPLRKSVSATTRSPRPGEVDGDAYHFLTKEDFLRRKEAGDFIETEEVFGSGYWYGTLKSEVDEATTAEAWAFLEIDVRGALKVMEQYPNAVTIFLTTPSPEEYERRLRDRGTEDEAKIQRRLQTAREELKFADRYRYTVINDDLNRTVEEISEILKAEESK